MDINLIKEKRKNVIEERFFFDNSIIRKYNAIVKFINSRTIYEDGCLGCEILDINYDKKNNTIDISVEIFSNKYNIEIANAKEIYIDRKYNTLERRY